MAQNAYLRLAGSVQGEIKGSVAERGRSGAIKVIAFNHTVTSPRNMANGLLTGNRQHHFLTITKEIDRSTPQLMNLLIHNETIENFELSFWQPSRSGRAQLYYTIRLYDASVTKIRQEMPNTQYPENIQLREREHVSFCYRRIEWIYTNGGVSAKDDWKTPNY